MVPKPLNSFNTWLEIGVRAVLVIIFLQLERSTPFKRKIHPDELWHYRNPRTDDYVHINVLFPLIICIPLLAAIVNYFASRDRFDLSQASLSLTLALGLNGVLTNLIKVLVGRPRPDFFWRCFPDGEMNNDMMCTGDQKSELEGRKSFPSGHSSFAFAGMGFLTWYLMGKLNTFNRYGRGDSWRLTLCILPLVCATVVAISRTCDYHHHWQDVVVGSLLGLGLSYLCYRQYYPSLSSNFCNRSYYSKLMDANFIRGIIPNEENSSDIPTQEDAEYSKLMNESEKDVKWI